MSGGMAGPDPIPFRFERADRLCIEGREYVYLRPTDEGHVLRRVNGDLDEAFSHEEMATKARLRSFRHDRAFFKEGNALARARAGVASLNELPPAELPKIIWKHQFCFRFREMEAAGEARRTDESMEEAIPRIAAGIFIDAEQLAKLAGQPITVFKSPCPRTLRTWLNILEDGGDQVYALRECHRRKGNRCARLEAVAYELLSRHAANYASEKRPTVEKLHRDLAAEVDEINTKRAAESTAPLAVPSLRALRERVADLPAFDTYAARHGRDKAVRHFNLVKEHPDVVRPGQRVEMDEWTINLQKILIKVGVWCKLSESERKQFTGRRVVCVAIDVATRCILGLRIGETAGSDLARETLRMALSDKGVNAAAAGAATPWDMRLTPDLVVTDGGSAFISDQFISVCADADIHRQVAKCKQPHLRGTIERFFRTADLGLGGFFSGRTFENISERGDYDSQARASLTDEDLAFALVRWVVDIYHNERHAGLGGETPRNAWLRLAATFGVRPAFGPDKERAVFGARLRRDISLRGVRFLGNHYRFPALAEHIFRSGLHEVDIRVDERDLGRISVLLGRDWHEADCVGGGFEGVSAATWLAALSELRMRHEADAEITRPIVLEAIRAINKRAAKAEAEVGIVSLRPSPERLEADEARIVSGFWVPIDDPGMPDAPPNEGLSPGDLLSNALEVGDAPRVKPSGIADEPQGTAPVTDDKGHTDDDETGYSSEQDDD